MADRVLHCWADGGEDVGSTCMLLDGHEGDHVFTPDDQIDVLFDDDDECIADDITECDCSRCTAADLAHDHVNGGHGTDDPEHFEDGCPECEAEQKERERDDVDRHARRDLALYGISAVEISSDGSRRRVDPRFVVIVGPGQRTDLFDPMVADHADAWGQPRLFRKRKRVELARERRTRTALNHLARRARRRAKRRTLWGATCRPGVAYAWASGEIEWTP